MKHTVGKRLGALTVALVMLCGLLPGTALAAGEEADAGTTVSTADDLNAAIAAIADSGKVTLGGPITVSTGFTIGSGKSVTLDLKGQTLTVPGSVGALFQVNEGGSLIIEDSGNGGKIDAKSDTSNPFAPVTAVPVSMAGGEFWLKGGTLSSANSAVKTSGSATNVSFLMTGGKLEGTGNEGIGLSLRNENNIAVVVGGEITGGRNALYLEGASHTYLGGNVTTSGAITNASGGGVLTVTGGEHSGVLYNGSSYSTTTNVSTTRIYGGTFHGVSQNTYGTLELYGGTFEPTTGLSPNFSFKTSQGGKKLKDYKGQDAMLSGSYGDLATVSEAFSVTLPRAWTPKIVGIFGTAHGTVKAGSNYSTVLDNTNRLLTTNTDTQATPDVGYQVESMHDSFPGCSIISFVREGGRTRRRGRWLPSPGPTAGRRPRI